MNLATLNLGGVAVDLSRLLQQENTSEEEATAQLTDLYREAFRRTLEDRVQQVEVDGWESLELVEEGALEAIRPGFPSHHPHYEALLGQAVEDHGYLLGNEQKQNPDPLLTEGNLLSALVRIVVVVFNAWPEEKRKEVGNEDGFLELFEGPEQAYRFVTLLEGTIGSERLDFRRNDLRRANLFYKWMRNVNLSEANLSEANLSPGRGLKQTQITTAVIDEATILPPHLRRSRPKKGDS